MYWIYLVIFVFLVFVPEIIRGNLGVFGEETVEEIVLLFLGGTIFIFYLIRDSQIQKIQKELDEKRRENNRMLKDLTQSYSFIGEINRKLEIAKNIFLGLPEWSKKGSGNKKESFEYIMASIKALTKSQDHCLLFVFENHFEKIWELKSNKDFACNPFEKKLFDKNRRYYEDDQFMTVISPENIEGIVSIIKIRKKTPHQTLEDPDILKALATQALFLFVFLQKNKRLKK